jgi:hypothetical protein
MRFSRQIDRPAMRGRARSRVHFPGHCGKAEPRTVVNFEAGLADARVRDRNARSTTGDARFTDCRRIPGFRRHQRLCVARSFAIVSLGATPPTAHDVILVDEVFVPNAVAS